MVSLSPRLQGVLGLCGTCGVLADIGTDHAYLPIAAVSQGLCKSAIASDLHPGPLEIAAKNIARAGLAGQIETRLGDGLMPISPGEADCIVIAGMGGMRIWGILLEGSLQARLAKRLVLQPQHDIVLLRKNLHSAGFEIRVEQLIRETIGGKEHFYVVLAAAYTAEISPWTEREYFLGKFLLEAGGEVFSAYIKREREKIAAYEAQVSDPAAMNDIRLRLEWLGNSQ